jgi:hypothetical protein
MNDCKFPIDVVYTWVEDTYKHRLKRSEYSKQLATHDGNGTNRYDSHDEIKYSIRSIYKYAPWVHTIFIVSDDDQRPAWLHPNSRSCSIPIIIIKHSQIIPLNHLPTFNSQAIEAHLHRIPGLSEHFIYFNDDMFLGNIVRPTDFFTSDGRPRYFMHGETQMVRHKYISMHSHAWVNNNQLLNHMFGVRKSRLYPTHQAVAMLKSSFEHAWSDQRVKPYLEQTSSSRFRAVDNLYFIGFLIYWNIHHGHAAKGENNGFYINYSDKLNFSFALLRIEHTKPRLFCINDNLVRKRILGNMYLRRFFESYFNWTTIAEV